MNGVTDLDSDGSEFVEVDPTGRYGRYNAILGKGASKTVYRAFDEYEGIEVAWNQVKLYDFLQSPEDLERLYCEIHLLKTLKHKNIMKFYTSWVDTANRNINFVTEMFTSGTLRQYRLKHKKINTRAIKHWCRQILQGLLYLHSHDPPVIHRDLKCDNIFINGNQGEVKIGDLGLAAILRKSHAARCVGTPEFMAPEVYQEEYNELVDIYSFGMCILEMVTFEYPYSECNHPAQIYKKVISGKKPDALYKVKDPEVRRFVEKCLAPVSNRLSAWELLKDPFLQIDDYGYDLKPLNYQRDYDEICPVLKQPPPSAHHSYEYDGSLINGYSDYLSYEQEHEGDLHSVEYEGKIDLFASHEDEHLENVGIKIKGRKSDDGNIFLRLRIADKEDHIRNIYFPFDIELDTALSVATEMVAELDITDQDITKIAEMIDTEIASLVPEWRTINATEESPIYRNVTVFQNCSSDDSVTEPLKCSKHGHGSIHGRFEEITYQVEESNQTITNGAPLPSSQSDDAHYAEIWTHENEIANSSTAHKDATIVENKSFVQDSPNTNGLDEKQDCEKEIRQEMRWLKAKYHMQLREVRDQQLGILSKSPNSSSENKEFVIDHNGTDGKVYSYESAFNSCSMVTAKSFYSEGLIPHSLHKATSLPVDATDC